MLAMKIDIANNENTNATPNHRIILNIAG